MASDIREAFFGRLISSYKTASGSRVAYERLVFEPEDLMKKE